MTDAVHNIYQIRPDVWLEDLRFYVPFNSIPVIAGRCEGDIEKLYAVEPRLRFPSQAGFEPGPLLQQIIA